MGVPQKQPSWRVLTGAGLVLPGLTDSGEESREHTEGLQLFPDGLSDQRRTPASKGYVGRILTFLPLL